MKIKIQNMFTRITEREFHSLTPGDTVYVKSGSSYLQAEVVDRPYYNEDANEPDWEVETTHGSCDQYSLYKDEIQ